MERVKSIIKIKFPLMDKILEEEQRSNSKICSSLSEIVSIGESLTDRSYQATPAFSKEKETETSTLVPRRISLTSENMDEIAEIDPTTIHSDSHISIQDMDGTTSPIEIKPQPVISVTQKRKKENGDDKKGGILKLKKRKFLLKAASVDNIQGSFKFTGGTSAQNKQAAALQK